MTELEEKLAQCAMEEVERPTLGTTEQFLEVHEVVYENGRPKVARVDTDDPELAIVYFPVKGEEFFYALSLSAEPEVRCWGMYAEPYTSVYLCASSKTDDKEQLMACTSLQPTRIRNRGDKQGQRGVVRQITALHFEPHPGPDAIEDKLKKMLDYLEQDIEGVKKLVEKYEAGVAVAMNFHDDNLGGQHLDAETLKRLAALGVWIDFDLYTSGNSLK